jgi:hypothetical protein
MDGFLDASTSTLIAQVRKADASHKIDTAHQLLRGRHFSGPSRVVYLGDVAKALLAQLPHPETPEFVEPPGYNEQRWVIRTTSGDLKVSIASRAYWAWGLLTSGYLNIITLDGPVSERARLVLDVTSSLGQSPWEMAHQRPAQKWLNRHLDGKALKENELEWRALFETGRHALGESIEAMKLRCTTALEHHDEEIDHATWQGLFDEDLHMAQRALAEDNAPGVERALARLEASLIQLNNEAPDELVVAPQTVVSDGSDVLDLSTEPPTPVDTVLRTENTEEVPFVDLAGNLPSEEE